MFSESHTSVLNFEYSECIRVCFHAENHAEMLCPICPKTESGTMECHIAVGAIASVC